MKICTRCLQTKEYSEFDRGKGYKEGFLSWCKSCRRTYNNERNKRVNYRTQYEWRKNNREVYLESRRRHREKHKDEINSKKREWAKRNHEHVLLYNQQRKRERRYNPNRITRDQWKSLCSFYGNICLACGSQGIQLTADHIVPLSRGGFHHLDNLQPLCLLCNQKKHTKIIDYRPSDVWVST